MISSDERQKRIDQFENEKKALRDLNNFLEIQGSGYNMIDTNIATKYY
jgi:hypothetical protein